MKWKKALAGLLAAVMAFNSNAATVLATGGSTLPSTPSAVSVTAEPETPLPSETVTLTAEGMEESAELQWQQLNDDGGWEDIAGATKAAYEFSWPQNVRSLTFRAAVKTIGSEEWSCSEPLCVTARVLDTGAIDTDGDEEDDGDEEGGGDEEDGDEDVSDAVAPPEQAESVITVTADVFAPAAGDTVTLTGEGFAEGALLQWQMRTGSELWTAVEGATSASYPFVWPETENPISFRLGAQAPAADGEAASEWVYSDALTLPMDIPLLLSDLTDNEGTPDFGSFEDAADYYYGEEGTKEVGSVTVTIAGTEGNSIEGNTVKAGQNLQLTLGYSLKAAASYTYFGTQQVQTLFDTYDNTKLVLTLPEGLRVTTIADNLSNVTSITQEGNVWTIALDPSIKSDNAQSGTLVLNVLVEDNGELEIGKEFAFGSGSNLAELQTSITIRDKTNNGNQPTDIVYEKKIPTESALPALTSTSIDQWGIQKKAGPAIPDAKKEYITVTFELQIGLIVNNAIVSNTDSYTRFGRVPFASIALTETPSVTDRDGNPIQPTSITITPDFGNKTPVPVSAGTPVIMSTEPEEGELPIATHGVQNSDHLAPSYSTYTVKVVYPYEKFIAQYYEEDQDPLTIDNTAQIAYVRKGEQDWNVDTSSASVRAGEVTQPAKITIQKYIVGADGTIKTYNSSQFQTDDPVSGEVTFTITKQDDGSDATLYLKNEDGTYIKQNGSTVSFVPNGTGSVTVYLDPGTYVVKETALPKNTAQVTAEEDPTNNADDKTVAVDAGETESASFYNKETLGSITIKKTGKKDGQTDSLLEGATFGLYSDKNCGQKIKEGKTDDKGELTFSRLADGTYWVKEIQAPEGYLLSNEIKKVQITNGAANPADPLTFTNTYNEAYVKLTKWLYDLEEKKYVCGNTEEYAEEYEKLENVFEVQKKGENNAWEKVQSVSLTSAGSTNAIALPVYDNNGTAITYRFAEKLPEGFHADKTKEGMKEEDGWAYSEEFTLEDEIGNSSTDPEEIDMYNTRNGSIEVTKIFYEAGTQKMEIETGKPATFDLYYQDGTGEFKKYNSNETPYRTDTSGVVNITDLPLTGDDGEDRSYYLVERSVPGHQLTSVETGSDEGFAYEKKTISIGGDNVEAVGPFIFTAEDDEKQINLSRKVTLTNVEQKVPVIIKKENFYTHDFVADAKYKIYEYEEDKEEYSDYTSKAPVVGGDDGGEEVLEGGSFQKLDPGKEYIVFETTVPDKYTNMQESGIRINLIGVKMVTSTTTAETVTLKNKPDPTLTITKFLIGADGKSTFVNNGKAEFEVYEQQLDDSFTRVNYYGTNLTVQNGTPVQLPAGTYYLKETKLPDNVLDPKIYHELYKQASGTEIGQGFRGEYVAGKDDEDDAYYFGPIHVTNTEENKGSNSYFINNYAATGAVQVKKLKVVTGGGQQLLSGATIAIYKQGDIDPQGTQVSDNNGIAIFSNLPIYDGEGKKITYVIRETKAPDGYTVSDQEYEVTLVPGETVTKGKLNGEEDPKELTFINLPQVSFRVTKVFYNSWEHMFTEKEYLLPGTKVALYRWDADHENETGEEQGAYVYETVATTNELGEVIFTGLNQKDKYVAIEVSIPKVPDYQYYEPEKEKLYLPWDTEKNCPAEDCSILTQKQLDEAVDAGDQQRGYNYVTKEALDDNADPVSLVSETLTNVENWAQVHIFKYRCDQEIKTPLDNQKDPVNNAQFSLYMEVIDEEKTEQNTELKFDLENRNNPEKYTLIGIYTSGTMYGTGDDNHGERLDGWFSTSILKSAGEIVYWLVEDTPGIGATLRPESKITLIRRSESGDAAYTNASTYTAENGNSVMCTGVIEYKNNKVVSGEVRNHTATGEGDPPQYTTVRIAKWAGSFNSDGKPTEEYTPLGNATFELWLVDENGNKLVQLDTLTTGLDNNLSEDGSSTAAGGLTAWASSRAFSLDSLKTLKGTYPGSFHEDKDGNTYVRAALVESGAPAGYQTNTDQYYLYMFFKKPTGEEATEIFNDVFYVKEQSTNDVDVADEKGVQFSLYPTKETAAGTYERVMVTDVPEGTLEKQFRLVNWPTDNFAVTVRKYGYEVNDETVAKTSEELNEHFTSIHSGDRTPLSVTMKLQRWYNAENKWKDYNYPGTISEAFFTTTGGSFTFPKGLPIGRYRIIETVPDAAYENIYTGEEVTPEEGSINNAEAYYFSVTTENLNLTLYNPKKLKLSVEKKSLDESKQIDDASFSLKTGTSILTATTGNGGKAAFTNLASGNYVLSETSAGTGYSNEYFAKWFQKEYENDKYNGLARFVTSPGIFLGFTTELQDGEMIVTEKTDLSSYGFTDGSLTLTVKNPPLVSLTVEKRDAQSVDKLGGAEFSVEFIRFTSVNGSAMTISSDAKWTGKGTITTSEETGQATANNLIPGIYRIKETKAPEGYDISDSSYQYVVLTGGLKVGTVTVDGKKIPQDTNSAENPLVFEDKRQVNLVVKKEVQTGALAILEDYTFTFKLYASPDAKQPIATQTIRIAPGMTQEQLKALSVTFSGLSQGETYYLVETTDEDFALESVVENGTVLNSENGYYKIEVPSDGSDVTVTATNVYLYAEIYIRKVNGNTGEDLSNAGFEILRTVDSGGTTVGGIHAAFFEEVEGQKGVYFARVPLRGNSEETFRIIENTAPPGYVKDDSHYYTDIILSPGQKLGVPAEWNRKTHFNQPDKMLEDRIFPNYPGAVITITKYDGTKENTRAQVQNGVTFELYRYDTDTSTWVYDSSETTTDGTVTFTVPGRVKYAVRENPVPAGYAGLQDVVPSGSSAAAQKAENVSFKDKNGDDQTGTLYLMNNGNALQTQKYFYCAYNTPFVELEVRKQLVGGGAAEATVNVYEVAETTSKTLTQDQVKSLMANTPVLSGIQVKTKSGDEEYCYANKSTDRALGTTVKAGSTYLVVETESSVPQLRDNKDVVWYQVITIPAGSTEKQIVTLENLDASVTIALEKQTVTQELKSLFETAADVTYKLTPTVTNSYPLTELTVTDDGLTAYYVERTSGGASTGAPQELNFDAYLKDKYSITSVKVPQATHRTGSYADGDSALYPIQTTVEFIGFNDQVIHTVTIKADATNRTASLPVNSTQKAKRVRVTYQSEEFRQATSSYVLGQDVQLGTLELKVHIDQQESGAGIQAISQIKNTAQTTAKYAPWGKNGVQVEATSQANSASVTDNFAYRTTAIVKVTKEASSETVSLNGTVDYTITISNDSDATAPMTDPFLVDLLPQGASLVSTPDEVEENIRVQGSKSQLAFTHMRTQTYSGETGVFVFLKGELAEGESVSVTLSVKAGNAVAAYGTEMKNFVIVGSDKAGYVTTDNPQGASFQNENRQWAPSFNLTLTSFTDERREILRQILGDRMANYGYISSYAGVKWTTASNVTLVKSAYGDRNIDDGYTTDILSTVSNGGTMYYRLTVSNTSQVAVLNQFSVVDILPYEGDTILDDALRYSKWDLTFDDITKLTIVSTQDDGKTQTREVGKDQYKVYFTKGGTGAIRDSAIYEAAETLKFDTAEPLPQAWSETKPEDVKAFILATDGSVELQPGESLLIEYTATVNGGEDLSADELSEISYTNAVNSFLVHCSSNLNNGGIMTLSLDSNSVSNTILPDPVKVGGHIWIDKNKDGVWTPDESISNFTDNYLIQQMLQEVEVQLYTYSGSSSTITDTDPYDQQNDANWYTEANFQFAPLDAAALLDKLELYGDQAYPNGVLDPKQLKGDSPKTYQIGITLPNTVKGIFGVTLLGKTSGYSRDPAELYTTFENEAADNNYTEVSTSNMSERFYLWAYSMDTFDNTKDIGLVPYRDLEIVKEDENGNPLANAAFAVYGPFDPGSAEHTCTDGNKIQEVKTNNNGELTIEGLLWFMDYVIVEKAAPSGYTIEDATATRSNGTNVSELGEGRWLLETPEASKTTPIDTVYIVNNEKQDDPPTPPTNPPTNPRTPPHYPLDPPPTTSSVSFIPWVEKRVEGDAREQESTFRFLLTADGSNPSGGAVCSGTSVTLTGPGTASFGAITFYQAGTYLFYIREDTSTPLTGYVCDGTVWTLRVNVAEQDDRLSLVGTPVYEAGGTDRTDNAVLTNTYETPPENPIPPEEASFEPPTVPDSIPATGDAGNLPLWFLLMSVSGAAVLGLTISGLRRRRRQ